MLPLIKTSIEAVDFESEISILLAFNLIIILMLYLTNGSISPRKNLRTKIKFRFSMAEKLTTIYNKAFT